MKMNVIIILIRILFKWPRFLIYCNLLFTLAFPIFGFAQTKTLSDTSSSDCTHAKWIKLESLYDLVIPTPAVGFGMIQEGKVSGANDSIFVLEHHSHWILVDIIKDGQFTFRLVPGNGADDYDFSVYKLSNSITDFCAAIRKKTPIRTNFAKNAAETKSVTGLDLYSRKKYVRRGGVDGYSSYINVQKGEKYLLLVDAPEKAKSGFKLQMSIKSINTADASVTEKMRKMYILTNIKCAEGVCDSFFVRLQVFKWQVPSVYPFIKYNKTTGEFSMQWDLKQKQLSCFIVYNQKSFLKAVEFTPSTINKLKETPIVLDEMRKGDSYRIKNFHFIDSTDFFIDSDITYAMLESLLEIMKKHANLKISITCRNNKIAAGLGMKRVERIKNYLVKKGIVESRIEVKSSKAEVHSELNEESFIFDIKSI
jgi:hypothetical protein